MGLRLSTPEDERTPKPHTKEERVNAEMMKVGVKSFFPLSSRLYCRSYSPLPIRFKTLNPAFFASLIDTGFSFVGVLKVEMIFRTGFRQAGQLRKGSASNGRRSVKCPPHAAQSPPHNSYSYSGIVFVGHQAQLAK
jgi:hypothetical protein